MGKVYRKMGPMENVGWCKPLGWKKGRSKIIMAMDEGTVAGLRVGEVDVDLDILASKDAKIVAKALGVLMENAEEFGCRDCPWRDTCDTMDNNG